MVPRRSVVMLAVSALLVILATSGVGARLDDATPAAPKPAPIGERPYRVRAFVSFDPATRIDSRARVRLLNDWLDLAARMVGPSWLIEAVEAEGPAAGFDLATVAPADLKALGADADKVWAVRGVVESGALRLLGRELDMSTGYLGSLHAREVPYPRDLARELFGISLDIFAPFAEIGEARGDVVPLSVQASALPPGQMGDAIAPAGSIFRPIRIFPDDKGGIQNVMKVLYSYLRVESRDGPACLASQVRGVRDPLTRRFARKNRLVALGIKPAESPTRLRFVESKETVPASGYILQYKGVPKGVWRDVATTDREGRVTLPAGFADGLVIFRLVAGTAEPMLDVPIMPGETDEELTIPFDPRPLTVTLEARLDSLKDAIVDQVAVRSRLERRMKAREQGDDWAGVAEALAEFAKLPSRDIYVKQLDALVDEAQGQENRLKTLVLTRNARAQIDEVRALIARYLDDETFRAYEDAVLRAKERDAKAKAKATIKRAPRPAAPAEKPAAPPPAKAAPAAPQPGGIPF